MITFYKICKVLQIAKKSLSDFGKPNFKPKKIIMGYDGVDIDCVKTEHTDYVMDLLAEMDKWENGKKSIFDEIKQDDSRK